MPVYMLQAGGFGSVKIGTSADPLARKRQLQTSMPQKLRIVRVLEGGKDEETALHERFADQRKNGEWFDPTDAMLTGDLGLKDLPIPHPKRGRGRYHNPATAYGRWRLLQDDLFESIGGALVLAKALGVPPWVIEPWDCNPYHLSALVLLARQAGAPIRLGEAIDVCVAAQKESEKASTDRRAASRLQDRQKRERKWIEKHGRDNAWWPLDPVNEQPPGGPLQEAG